MSIIVWITTTFQGEHRWADAPEDVAFLQNWHRHLFHVKVGVTVGHGDREVEFFKLKRQVDAYIADRWANRQFLTSCEMIAIDLLDKFKAAFVQVSEDGENGALISFDPLAPTVSSTEQEKCDVGGLGPVTSLVKTKCFVGMEAEGPNRGRQMLFVPGSISLKNLNKALCQTRGDVWGVYYGAGNDRVFQPDVFTTLLKNFDPSRVTIEILHLTEEIADHVLPYRALGLFIVSLDPIDEGEVTYIKLVGSRTVRWVGDAVLYTTNLDDPLFVEDLDVQE